MNGRFEPLRRCPGLEHDDRRCPSLIDGSVRQLCGDCARRETQHNPRRPLDQPPKPAEPTPPKPEPAKPKPSENALVECCGPIGAGCPHDAKIIRRGKVKRCRACQQEFDEAQAKPAKPLASGLWRPHRVPGGGDLPQMPGATRRRAA